MDQAKMRGELLHAKINQETAKIPWIELQRFFARGRVIAVGPELDLVEIAAMAADDRAGALEAHMTEGRVAKVSDEQARLWLGTDALLWTVVVKPWIFVQDSKPATGQQIDERPFKQREPNP